MNKYLVSSLAVILFLTGVGVGYVLTPEYARMKTESLETMDLGRPDKWFDLRYINNMIAHHQSVIYMLEQAKIQSKRDEIQNLSGIIIDADTKGIATLYSWKNMWYGDTRKVTRFTKTNIGTYDEQFDLRLMNALIVHHDEAIEQAKNVLTKSTRNEILTLASTVIAELTENEKQLKAWRSAWYGIL